MMTQMASDSLQHPAATTASHAEGPAPHRLLESAMAFWRSAVLLGAHEVGLFAELSAGPRDAGALASRLGLLPDPTADWLDALVALGLIEQSGAHYRNTPEASLYLDPARPAYIGQWLAMAGAAMRELADPARHLRAASATVEEHPSLAGQMWADIAGVLRGASAHDDA